MVTWGEFRRTEPRLAVDVQATFAADRHAVLATVRADGAPRASGIEPVFHDEDLMLFLMPDSVKSADLRRDPRCGLHSATSEHRCGWHNPEIAAALPADDAKIGGRVVPVTDAGQARRFLNFLRTQTELPSDAAPEVLRIDIEEVSTVRGSREGIVIRSWRPGEAARIRRRA